MQYIARYLSQTFKHDVVLFKESIAIRKNKRRISFHKKLRDNSFAKLKKVFGKKTNNIYSAFQRKMLKNITRS